MTRTFNPAHRPDHSAVPALVAHVMLAAFLKRRALGLNVQFINATSGQLDEWSFETAEKRDRFIARLVAEGINYVVSE